MPQVVIRPRSGGTGGRSTEVSTEKQVLVIINDDQIEIYTDQDAQEKLASEQ